MAPDRLPLPNIAARLALLTLLLPGARGPGARAFSHDRPGTFADLGPALPPDTLPALCSTRDQLLAPAGCALLGPGAYAQELTSADLPYPLPAPVVTPLGANSPLVKFTYARVITDAAPVYRHPLEALHNLPPLRVWEKGFDFVSLTGETVVDGAQFYQINASEFMRAADLQIVAPSGFGGQYFSTPPGAPVGWIITRAQPSPAPGQPPAPDAPFAGRYQFFQVLAVQRVGDWNWYLIGPGQWVEQRYVGLVQPAPPPGGGARVIGVDTYEQTLGVYENGGLIFATLVSSGSRSFPTRPGVFSVWAKWSSGKMSGAYRPDRSDYYYLEDVPWILYYDGARALHGAYWHDHFGLRSSHGCVNLSPRDARWLYSYAGVGSTVVVFSSQ